MVSKVRRITLYYRPIINGTLTQAREVKHLPKRDEGITVNAKPAKASAKQTMSLNSFPQRTELTRKFA